MKLFDVFLIVCFLGVFKIKGGSSAQQSRRRGDSWQSDDNLMWPIGEGIAYYIDPDFNDDEQRQIKEAVKELSGSLGPGCLSFLELKDSPDSKEYMKFIHLNSYTCSSDLGMQRGEPTKIQLGPECFTEGVILHELVHALGAMHEQARPDRDFYVTINRDFIKDGKLYNFDIDQNYTRTSQTPYDFFSITHYSSTAYAKNKSVITISSKFKLGQDVLGYENKKLSATDKIEISKVFECPVDKSLEADYLEYIDELFTEVMEKFRICIENSTRPDEDCKLFCQESEKMLEETRRVTPRGLFHAHNIEYQVALNRLNQRRIEWNMEIKLEEIRSKSIVSARKLTNMLTKTRKKNEKLQQDLAKLEQKHSDEIELIRGVFGKPWFRDPDVHVFGNKGYQVIEWKNPVCNEKFLGGKNEATINSQAELEFISELLGDRAAMLGGGVHMSTDRPSYAGFRWWDESSTEFFNTLEKKFNDKGAGKYSPWLKSGEIYFGPPYPKVWVCEYP